MRSWLLVFLPLSVVAQDVRVVSEFRRIDGKGEILAADRGGTLREILSPAAPRNAFSSFRIVMEVPAGGDIWLEVGQNPEDAVDVTVYEESGAADGSLRHVTLPYRTKLAPGVGTATLWMDLWVKRDAPVGRIKVEPQLYFQEHWYTYPMEVRIVQPVVPNTRITRGRKPADGARADAAVRELAREQLCGATPEPGGGEPSIWQMTRRNALQDLALAGSDGFSAAVVKAAGAASAADWCAKPASGAANPEWYLRVRDIIYRSAGAE